MSLKRMFPPPVSSLDLLLADLLTGSRVASSLVLGRPVPQTD